MKRCVPLADLIFSTSMAFLASTAAFAQGTNLPWGQPSDMVAWEVFTQITAPSGNPQGTNVEFETWATEYDVYSPTPKWTSLGAPKRLQVSLLGESRQHGRSRVNIESIQPGQC